MDLSELALKLYELVKPVFTGAVVGEIVGDFTEASKGTMIKMWDKIKHWFINEDGDSEELQDVKANPDDKDFDETFISKLKSKLKKDPALKQEIENLLAEMDEKDIEKARIVVKNSKNVVAGAEFTNVGNITIGDNNNTPPTK